MSLKLSKSDQTFRNPLIFAGDAKTIDLDRVLLNLFMLIKYNGVRPAARLGRKEITIDTIVKKLANREADGAVKGFSGNEDKARCWVAANLVDMVNRGNPEKEAVVSLRAIHLDAYKYRNPKHARDYKISEQVYSMLREVPANLNIVDKLSKFLGIGWNRLSNTIVPGEGTDLDTLGILRVVEKEMVKDSPSGDHIVRYSECICPGQARVFADDVRRLLVYQQTVPRHVLLEYMKTLIGLHVGLYLLRLFLMLPNWISQGERPANCKDCQVRGDDDRPFHDCPYRTQMVVDCGNAPHSDMARLAEEDTTYYYARIQDYIRATFGINMAFQYIGKKENQKIEDLDQALEAIKNGGQRWETWFQIRLQNLFDGLEDDVKDVFKPVLDLKLSHFDTFVEVVNQARAGFHFKYHRELLDSLFQSNRDTGLIWHGRSRKYKRRFWLSSRLLETLVQLSVLKSHPGGNGENLFSSEPILIDEFVNWLEHRYGFILNGVGHERFHSSGIMVHQAFKENILNLKERLREIGFFNVLSDAYIMQRIRPRYPIEHHREA